MCIPFAWANPKVQSLSSMDVDWIGKVSSEEYWYYLDYGLLLIFGGIPWQVYFQRVLSSKTAGRAQVLSYVAAIGCILMAIPPVLIGAIAKATREYRKFNYWLIKYPANRRREPITVILLISVRNVLIGAANRFTGPLRQKKFCEKHFRHHLSFLRKYLNFIINIFSCL